MKISINLDGVLFDFPQAFTEIVNERFPGTLKRGYAPPDWDWTDKLTPFMMGECWKLLKSKHNWWLDVPTYDENVEALRQFLIKHSHENLEIYFVTSRAQSLGMPMLSQCDWALHRCGLVRSNTSIIPVSHSKMKPFVFNAIGIDFGVDDYDQNVNDASRMCPNSVHYLLSRSWNAHSDLPRVATFTNFLSRIEEAL